MLCSHCLVFTQSTQDYALALQVSFYVVRHLFISASRAENDCSIFDVDVRPNHDGKFALLIWETNVTIHVSITPPNGAVESFSVRAPAIMLFCGNDFAHLNVW